MRSFPRWAKMGLAAASSVILLSASGLGASASTAHRAAPAAGPTLKVAVSADALGLDPQTTADLTSANVFMNIFDYLVTLNAKGKIVPMLATRWTQPNADTWIFYLRPHVEFSNGDPLTAQTVKASFERELNPATAAPRASLFSAIKTIKVLSPTEVEFITATPFAPLLANLDNYAAGIVDPKAAQAEGKQYTLHPVGSGPFELQSWQQGSQLVLVRNPHYWGPAPKIAKIVFQVVPSDATRLSLLESGQVQVAEQIPPAQLTTLAHVPGVQVDSAPGFPMEYIGFNDQMAPFNNVLVRQALTYATNRALIVKSIYRGTASLANDPIPPSVFGYDPVKLKAFPYDPAMAQKLLDQAGYKNGFTTTIYTSTADTTWMQVAQVLQQEWAKVHVKVKIQNLEWGTFLQYTAEPNKTPIFIIAWSNNTGDADYNQTLFACTAFGNLGNRDFYCNKKVQTLILAARAQTNPKLRIQDYGKIEQIETEQVPMMYLGWDRNIIAQRTNVHGILMAPSSVLYFRNASIGS